MATETKYLVIVILLYSQYIKLVERGYKVDQASPNGLCYIAGMTQSSFDNLESYLSEFKISEYKVYTELVGNQA